MPEGAKGHAPGPDVQRALQRLLRASLDFTRAYQAWSVDPVHHARELETAQARLDAAEHEAVLASSADASDPASRDERQSR